MIAVENVSKTYGRFGRRPASPRRGLPRGAPRRDGRADRPQRRRQDDAALVPPRIPAARLGLDPHRRPRRSTTSAIRARTGYMPERLGFDRDLTGRGFPRVPLAPRRWRHRDARMPRSGPRRPASASSPPPSSQQAADVLARACCSASASRRRRSATRTFSSSTSRPRAPIPSASLTCATGFSRPRRAAPRSSSTPTSSPEVEKVCDRVVFIDHGRLTRSETLTGDAASRRRATSASRPRRAPGPRRSWAAKGWPSSSGRMGCCAWSTPARRRGRARGQGARARRRRGARGPGFRPSSRSSFARRPRLDRDDPPVPAPEDREAPEPSSWRPSSPLVSAFTIAASGGQAGASGRRRLPRPARSRRGVRVARMRRAAPSR